jgi:hypothetical protein
MSDALKKYQALIQEAVDQEAIDMSDTSTGGGGARLYERGYAFARLVEYIEFGHHPDEYEGKVKAPAMNFRLGFAIWGKANLVPGQEPTPGAQQNYANEDGSPGIIRTFDLRISNNEKAAAKKAFDKMNYDGKAKQFYQFLGKPFLLRIDVNLKAKGGPRNRLKLDETLPPFDNMSGQPYKIPEAPDDLYKLFLWNKPTKETWDSLFIEGKNDEGKSKNWLQEKCLSAVDFDGSPLQALLSGGGLPKPEELQQQLEQPAAPAAVSAPQTAPAAEAPAAPAVADTPADLPFEPDAPGADLPSMPPPPVV